METIETQETEMPKTSAPDMRRIEFAVPSPLLEQALEIAAAEGWKPAEFYRVVWMLGINSYTDGSNKRLVNLSLRRKGE